MNGQRWRGKEDHGMTLEFRPWTTGEMVVPFMDTEPTGEGEILEGEIICVISDLLDGRCL